MMISMVARPVYFPIPHMPHTIAKKAFLVLMTVILTG